MPYAMHLRKSRADIEAEARGEGESLSRHEARLRAFADRAGLDIVAVYKEIISGDKLSERPEMQRLLADVSKGMYDGVLDVEISRLTRGDMMDQGYIVNTFKYSGTKIITPEHTYDLTEDFDEDIIASDMMMARREYKYIKRRLQRGRNSSAAEGLWQSPAPFGYRKIKIHNGKGWTLEPDPEQAPLVQMIFDLYANGHVGGSKIAEQLNALGSRTNKGNLWSASSVGQLSANPVYIGLVRWNDRVSVTRMVDGQLVTRREKRVPMLSKGKHPPIIDEATFYAAQEARRANDLTRQHNSLPIRNPLAGLVFCGVCGRTMTRKDNGNAQGSKYATLKCPREGCPTCATELSLVESSIIETLKRWAYEPKASAPAENKNTAQLDAAGAAVDRLRAQLDRIYAAYEDGAYDTAEFVRRRTAKQAEIDAAVQSLEDLKSSHAQSKEDIILAQLPRIRNLLDVYDLAPTAQDKNSLLKTVIDRVVYHKTQRSYRNQSAALHLTLEVFPRIPSD